MEKTFGSVKQQVITSASIDEVLSDKGPKKKCCKSYKKKKKKGKYCKRCPKTWIG